jgi:hypothetical protein
MPHRWYDSPTLRAYRLAVAALRKVFNSDWSEKHVENASVGFLRNDQSTQLAREIHMMRSTILAEMLWNLQDISGFDSCIDLMYRGDIEATYGALEIARMLFVRNVVFRFVERTNKKRADYDLEIFYPDGVKANGETKCKMEDTEITLGSVKDSIDTARKQLPKDEPGIVFVKVPPNWIEDDTVFASELDTRAVDWFRNGKRIVSIKYYTASITFESDLVDRL